MEETNDQLHQVLSSSEAAAELGIQRVTVVQLIRRGLLHGRLLGRTWVITRDEVERYKKERRPPYKVKQLVPSTRKKRRG